MTQVLQPARRPYLDRTQNLIWTILKSHKYSEVLASGKNKFTSGLCEAILKLQCLTVWSGNRPWFFGEPVGFFSIRVLPSSTNSNSGFSTVLCCRNGLLWTEAAQIDGRVDEVWLFGCSNNLMRFGSWTRTHFWFFKLFYL